MESFEEAKEVCQKKGYKEKDNEFCKSCDKGELKYGDLKHVPKICPYLELTERIRKIAFLQSALINDSLRRINLSFYLSDWVKHTLSVARNISSLYDFPNMVSRLQDFHSQLIPKISVINNIIPKIRPLLLPSFDYGKILEALNFAEDEEWKKFDYNWCGFLTIPEAKALFNEWKKGNKDKVTEYFNEQFDTKEKIDKLLERLEKKSFFKTRVKIVKDALYAHVRKEYTLSIPVLYAQIDGIFIEKHKEIMKGKKGKCPACGYEYNISPNAYQICKEFLSPKQKINAPFLDEFLNHVIDDYRHRSSVLHGINTDYDNQDTSTKLILALIEISEQTE